MSDFECPKCGEGFSISDLLGGKKLIEHGDTNLAYIDIDVANDLMDSNAAYSKLNRDNSSLILEQVRDIEMLKAEIETQEFKIKALSKAKHGSDFKLAMFINTAAFVMSGSVLIALILEKIT